MPAPPANIAKASGILETRIRSRRRHRRHRSIVIVVVFATRFLVADLPSSSCTSVFCMSAQPEVGCVVGITSSRPKRRRTSVRGSYQLSDDIA
jgi:hypothetical protein